MEYVTWVFLWISTPIELSRPALNLFMRIFDYCQCNSIFSLYVNSPLSDDSLKITLRNTGQNIMKRNLVVFIEGNKESCGTDNCLRFSNPPS